MPLYFRAVAIDYDGTLTDSNAPAAEVLAAIDETRRAGRKVVLVTGRILDALRGVFPAVDATFDAIVAENGAVIWTPQAGSRTVAEPVASELAVALARRGVPLEYGQVILATDVAQGAVVLEEIARLGLEAQLVRNRHALMILPPGISKGTGLLDALGILGISHHSTIAVGDAENDHSLLEACELGVAVANAVPALQAHADVVLGEPAGAGVAELLRGPLLRGEIRVQPRRWQVRLGAQPDGMPLTIPGSHINVLITGGAVSGKSCLAGLLAERLVGMRYSVCVLDPEGDHTGLGALRGVIVTGGGDPPPDAVHLARLLHHRFGSVVVDLSLRPERERADYCRRMLMELGRRRRETGLPHWIVIDEAHLVPEATAIVTAAEGAPPSGLCLVTYHPAQLAADTVRDMDLAVALPRGSGAEWKASLDAAGFCTTDLADVGQEQASEDEQRRSAVLFDRRRAQPFTVDQRVSGHVRHWHKYTTAELPPHRRFYFRRGSQLTGASAANMGEFHQHLARCDAEVLRHHASRHDFSRWIGGVMQDDELARRVHDVETTLIGKPETAEAGRRALLQAVEARYAE